MGIIADLSHHQGDIDWSKAHSQFDLAIIRVQYGSTIIDKKLQEYVSNCKNYNIPFGHYAYALYTDVADAEKEANDFLSRIDRSAKFLAIDVEEITVKEVKDVIPATQRFIDICKKAGYKVGLYSGEFFFNHYGLSKIKCDFLWVAKYSNNAPIVPHDIWQYTSSGSVSGITTKVDLNKLNGTKPLSYYTGVNPAPQNPPVVSKPKPHYVGKEVGTLALKVGDRGESIQVLNYQLAALGLISWKDRENDTFGNSTLEAVKKFQNGQHLKETGVYDFATSLQFAKVLAVYYQKLIQNKLI